MSLGTARALVPYQRRAILVAFLRAGLVAVAIALLAAELLNLQPDVVGTHVRLTAAIALIAGVLASGIYARATMPALRDVARRVDRAGRLRDLIVTAEERDERNDEVSAVLARAAVAAIGRVSPARVYPIEAPHQWRRWLALSAATQIIAIGLAWRAPDARPMPPSGAALSLPGSGVGQDAASGAAATTASPATANTPTPATATADTKPAAIASRNVVPAGASAGDAAASGTGAAEDAATSSVASLPDRETGGGGNSYRQAADRASDAIARGRVPAALRGIVERYFTAIRPQGQ
jgi:hypothetical protein